MFDLQIQHIKHTVSFRCLTFISPDLKCFQHETSTTLTATTNSSSDENTLVLQAHATILLSLEGGTTVHDNVNVTFGFLFETNNKTIKLNCSAFNKVINTYD